MAVTPHRPQAGEAQDLTGLSPIASEVFHFLKQRGASFFVDIVRGAGKLKAEIETGLWELVAAGLVTADGFDNLRSLINPKRRAGQGSGRSSRPRHSTGRWSLLYPLDSNDPAGAVEAVCRVLLARYGVVFRELLARESILPRWRDNMPGKLPEVPSVTSFWASADWHEREVFELSGIRFVGHPDLSRILLSEDWIGHPLRKDYEFPLEYHGIRGR